jgi:hypothetical protein
MNVTKKPCHPSERGNVIFYVLIAVALLAALSFAVARSTRGSINQVTEERSKMIANEIIQYANTFGNAVAQIRLRGISDSDMCFNDNGWGGADYPNTSCSDEATKIFGLKGGAVTWKKAPTDAMDAAAAPDYLWGIYGTNEVQDIGTTCGADSCADLILVLDELSAVVCRKINAALKIAGEDDAPPTDTELNYTRFNGTYTYQKTIGDEAGGGILAGKSAACFQKTAAPSKYTFYKVLIAR